MTSFRREPPGYLDGPYRPRRRPVGLRVSPRGRLLLVTLAITVAGCVTAVLAAGCV